MPWLVELHLSGMKLVGLLPEFHKLTNLQVRNVDILVALNNIFILFLYVLRFVSQPCHIIYIFTDTGFKL
jgi:hypothetical protein